MDTFESIYQNSEEIAQLLKHLSNKKTEREKIYISTTICRLDSCIGIKYCINIFFLFRGKKLNFQKKYICLKLHDTFDKWKLLHDLETLQKNTINFSFISICIIELRAKIKVSVKP